MIGIVWMYSKTPCFEKRDKIFQVNEIKKIQCKGGTQQGEANPTWLKQSSDKMVAGFVFAVAGMGLFRLGSGYYKLATGTGKIE